MRKHEKIENLKIKVKTSIQKIQYLTDKDAITKEQKKK